MSRVPMQGDMLVLLCQLWTGKMSLPWTGKPSQNGTIDFNDLTTLTLKMPPGTRAELTVAYLAL